MGKTYKDRDKVGRPRVPEWARAKPTRVHVKKNAKDSSDFYNSDAREDLFDEIYSNGEDQG